MGDEAYNEDALLERLRPEARIKAGLGTVASLVGVVATVAGHRIGDVGLLGFLLEQLGLALLTAGLLDMLLGAGVYWLRRRLAEPVLSALRSSAELRERAGKAARETGARLASMQADRIERGIVGVGEETTRRLNRLEEQLRAVRLAIEPDSAWAQAERLFEKHLAARQDAGTEPKE